MPLNNLLEVEGANGQTVPYLGYIELNLTFPPEFLGSAIEVDTLALVVPDTKTTKPLLLVGTNTLDIAYSKHLENHPVAFQPFASGYQAVLKILQHRHTQTSTDNPASVLTLQSNQPQTISPGQTAVLEGRLATWSLQEERAVIVEHPASFPLPGGLLVKADRKSVV